MIDLTEDWATNTNKNVYAIGNAFYKGEVLDKKDLVGLFSNIKHKNIPRDLPNLNGFWSAVIRTDHNIKILSDHVGSRAIFYNEELPFVTDDFSNIHAKFSDSCLSRETELEFMMSSYVSGKRTTNPKIKKTEPGTIVSIGNKGSSDIDRYYVYRNDPDPQPITDQLYVKWKQNLKNAFERSIKITNGRQILLGLSGGYDSRLIAMMLDRVGYDNVVTFTMDTGYDQQVGEKIANTVGFDWFPLNKEDAVEYEGYESDLWLKVINKLGKSGMYYRWPMNIAYDLSLLNHPLVEQNAVRMWGHQLYAGGDKTARDLLHGSSQDLQTIADSIYTANYNKQRFGQKEVKVVKNRIEENLLNKSWASKYRPFETSERWYWHERLPNFLFRDSFLRPYDVWYPLLDKNVVEFWNYIPAEDRYGKQLYHAWVKQLWRETYDTEFIDEETIRRQEQMRNSDLFNYLYLSIKYSKLGDTVSESKLKPYAKVLDNLISDSESVINKPADLDSRLEFVDNEYFQKEYTGSEHYRYFLVSELLSRID